MRRFLIGLAVFAVALSVFGGALNIDKAEAGKTVRIYCVAKKAPTYHGTRVRCYNPGMWVYVPYWYAKAIGTWPIYLRQQG